MTKKEDYPVERYSRGHKVLVKEDYSKEIYADTGKPFDDSRPCARCGQKPTKEGYDACLGHIENAENACCGHGVENGYIVLKNGRRIILIDDED